MIARLGVPLVLALALAGCRRPTSIAAPAILCQSTEPADETITVDVSTPLAPRRPLIGFVHGTRGPAFPAAATPRIAALSPASWKVATEEHYRLARSYGAEVTVAVSDLYFGYAPLYYPWNNPPRAQGAFDDWAAWTSHVRAVVDRAEAAGQPVSYWYPLNEPLIEKYSVPDRARLLESYVRGCLAVKMSHPTQKVVAPGTIGYARAGMEALLTVAESRGLHVDAFGWHEFGRPEQVIEHVQDFRALLKSHPMQAQSPILIDEYQSEAQHLLPGFTVGWLYYLEAAGVQQAMRACWDLPKPAGGLFETCWTGLNGLFAEDEVTPGAMYWVYERYARMRGPRLRTTSSAPTDGVALAARNGDSIELLAGRFANELGGPAAPPRSVRLEWTGLPAGQVWVDLQRIAYDGPDRDALPTPLETLPTPSRCKVDVQAGRAAVTVPSFADRDAWWVRLTPIGSR